MNPIAYEEEIIERAGGNCKPLSEFVTLTIDDLDDDAVGLRTKFEVNMRIRADDLSRLGFISKDDYNVLLVRNLLGEIERELYKILPAFNINSHPSLIETGTKIWIDSHLPDNVVLMSPKTYTKCKKDAPMFMHAIREENDNIYT